MSGQQVLSPECQLGMCELCPGNGPVYAPGKRRPIEPPIMVLRCDHKCTHKSATQSRSVATVRP